DNMGRVLTETLPDSDGDPNNNPKVTRVYDAAGNQTSLTDPVNNTTSSSFNNMNWQSGSTDPNNRSVTYGLDAAGNITSITDRNSLQRQFTYDAANRETAEKWLDSLNNVIRTITFGYNAAGDLTSASDPDSSYAFTYDAKGRLSTVDNQGTPGIARVILT